MEILEGHALAQRLQDVRLGMGGQAGGMVNEAHRFPEVCKKSLQAMAADMQGGIPADFFATYSIPQIQCFSPRELEHCGRLTQPMRLVRGQNYYEPVDWDDALTRIADKLGEVAPDETFWYTSGRSSNEAGFLVQLFARLYGTNNVNNCSYYCHQASGVGLNNTLGIGTATVTLEDIDHADLVFLIGGNPASNHPRLMTSLMHLRRRGGEVVVINPVREIGLINFRVPSSPASLLFGTKIASLYVQPDIGGDLALLTGVAKASSKWAPMTNHSSTGTAKAGPTWPCICAISIGPKSNDGQASRELKSMRLPIAMRGPRTSFSPGRWVSRTTCTAFRMSKQSRTWRCCAVWWAGRMRACCPFAATRTYRGLAPSA